MLRHQHDHSFSLLPTRLNFALAAGAPNLESRDGQSGARVSEVYHHRWTNGAGKTTFAREFLAKEAGVVHFVNPGLIAGGLSPLRPELAALAAGQLVLRELERLARAKSDFAFESTLSGLSYLARLKRCKKAGYRIEIVYLRISSPQLGLRRIAARVKQGGHNVPRADVLRRFVRSWTNSESYYRSVADEWTVYDNSRRTPLILEQSP